MNKSSAWDLTIQKQCFHWIRGFNPFMCVRHMFRQGSKREAKPEMEICGYTDILRSITGMWTCTTVELVELSVQSYCLHFHAGAWHPLGRHWEGKDAWVGGVGAVEGKVDPRGVTVKLTRTDWGRGHFSWLQPWWSGCPTREASASIMELTHSWPSSWKSWGRIWAKGSSCRPSGCPAVRREPQMNNHVWELQTRCPNLPT